MFAYVHWNRKQTKRYADLQSSHMLPVHRGTLISHVVLYCELCRHSLPVANRMFVYRIPAGSFMMRPSSNRLYYALCIALLSICLSVLCLHPTRSLAIAKRPCDCCIILKSGSYTKAIVLIGLFQSCLLYTSPSPRDS